MLAWGSETAFHPEPWGLHSWVTGRDVNGMTEETWNPLANHKHGQDHRQACTPHHNSTRMAVPLKWALLMLQRQEVTLPPRKMGSNELSDHPSLLGEGQIGCRKKPKAFPPALHLRREEWKATGAPFTLSSSENLQLFLLLCFKIYSYTAIQSQQFKKCLWSGVKLWEALSLLVFAR